MATRGLDPEMIAKVRDIVERNFSNISSLFEARLVDRTKKVVAQSETSLDDQGKDMIRKALLRCLIDLKLNWLIKLRRWLLILKLVWMIRVRIE